MEELAGQGVSKDQLPPWVGSRIKTPDPSTTPPDPSITPDQPLINPPKPRGTPQNPLKTPAYRAPDSEVPQDETNPSYLRGTGGGSGVDDPSTTLPARVEVPPDKALNIIEAQVRDYMKATDRANGTIVMVPVDRARIPR
jgi:hypothetical protein